MNTPQDKITQLHKQAPFTDVHIHPSLKAYLFNRNLWRHYISGRVFNPFSSRSDFCVLEKGHVGVIWVAHYYPERQLFRDCKWMHLARLIVPGTYKKLTSGRQIDRLVEMLDKMERETARRPEKTEIARSAADVQRIRAAGKIAVVHTVEGAHVLEGNLDHLDTLAARGVALLTLTHFYRNNVVAQADGIPKNYFIRKICRFDFQTGGTPITTFGKELLQKMNQVRMLVDITHCTPEARAAIFQEMPTDRPLLASHIGAQALNPNVYNLADDEIREIAKRGGAIGVIFMTYYLSPSEPKAGRDLLWQTMSHIRQITGSWDHVVIGTDFDGFTDPPDDIPDASKVGRLTAYLLQQGVSEADVKKILGGNAQRLLEQGWR